MSNVLSTFSRLPTNGVAPEQPAEAVATATAQPPSSLRRAEVTSPESCGVTSPYRFPIMIYPSPGVEPRKYRNIIILMANRHCLGRRPLEGRRFYPSPGKLPRVALRSI